MRSISPTGILAKFRSLKPIKWQKISCVVLMAQLAICLAIGWHRGFVFGIPLSSYLIVSILFSVFFTYTVAIFRLVIVRKPMPWPWLFQTCCAFGLIATQMAVLSWSKNMMPHVVGFSSDQLLADLDYAIFDTDPWLWLHQAMPWAGPFIDKVYISWAPVKFLVLLVLVVLPQNSERSILLCSYFITMSLGAISQYLMPSAGPIFFERIGLGDRFAAMPIAPWVEVAANYLWQDYTGQSGKLGTGISAMPSLHVAISAWFIFVARSQFPLLQLVAWPYFVTICVGSVYLGWHYAVDAVGGTLIAVAALFISRRLIREKEPNAIRGITNAGQQAPA